MDHANLISYLKTAQRKPHEWATTLEPRKLEELSYHNKVRDKDLNNSLPQDTYEVLHGNQKFYSTVEKVRDYMNGWLKKHVPGKVFLDFACGNGGQVIQAAKYGAAIAIGIDLSDVSIENAKQAAITAGVADRCYFIQGDCENTGLPAGSIDVILCSGVLHHMDLSYAFPEIRRILRNNGVALAGEALDYNPAIKLYREMTPGMRTEWEKNHILSLKDLRFAKRFFQLGEVRFWHLFSILAAFLKKDGPLFRWALKVFNALDGFIVKIPGLQLMAWQFTFEMRKTD